MQTGGSSLSLFLRHDGQEFDRLVGTPTSDQMVVAVISEGRRNRFTLCYDQRATRVKSAANRRVERTRHIALKHDPAALPLDLGIGDRHRRKKRLTVRVQWLLLELRP